ncbi:MAG: ABC transporter permease, partial [Chloroflexota bacterium]
MDLQLTLAGRYLRGRKLRTVLTTLAIVFGVLVVFGMNIIIPSMLASFQSNVLAAANQADITVTQKAGEAFNRSTINTVRAVPGVSAVSGSLSRTVNIPAGFFGRTVELNALTLVGIDPRAAQQLRDYPVKQGRFLRQADDKVAVITTSLADQLSLAVGDDLRLPTTGGVAKLKIVGLVPPRALPGNEEVLVTLTTAQKLLAMPDRINVLEANLTTTDESARQAIVDEVTNRLGPDYRLGALGGGSEYLASIKTGETVFSLLGFLALFMGGFIIFNTFRTVVAERRHDIGMLRSLGASRGTIVGIMVAEGLLQGALGTGVGLVLGYLLGAGILAAAGAVWSQFLHTQLGGPIVQPSLVVTAVVLGVGVTLLASLLPALSASRVMPLEALRPSVAAVERQRFGRGPVVGVVLLITAALALVSRNVGLVALGGLACLVGLILVAPALVQPLARLLGAVGAVLAPDGTAVVAQGNLTRQPSRVAI